MTNHRLLPPAGASKIAVNGRTYDPSVGAQDVPDFDSTHLQANGWSFLATSGATATRPNSPVGAYPQVVGARHWDTTVGHIVTWDGKNWRDEGGTIR